MYYMYMYTERCMCGCMYVHVFTCTVNNGHIGTGHLSIIWRGCPLSEVKCITSIIGWRIRKCPLYRGILYQRFHCMSLQGVSADGYNTGSQTSGERERH